MEPSGTFQARLPASISPPRSKVSLKIRCHPFIHLGGERLCSQVSSCLRSLHDSDTWFEQHRNSHMKMSGMLLGCKLRILVLRRFPGQNAKIFGLQGILNGPQEEI